MDMMGARFSSFSEILDHHAQMWLSWDTLQYGFNTLLAGIFGWFMGSVHEKPRINIGERAFAAVTIGTSLAAGCLLHISHLYNIPSILSAVTGILSGTG